MPRCHSSVVLLPCVFLVCIVAVPFIYVCVYKCVYFLVLPRGNPKNLTRLQDVAANDNDRGATGADEEETVDNIGESMYYSAVYDHGSLTATTPTNSAAAADGTDASFVQPTPHPRSMTLPCK